MLKYECLQEVTHVSQRGDFECMKACMEMVLESKGVKVALPDLPNGLLPLDEAAYLMISGMKTLEPLFGNMERFFMEAFIKYGPVIISRDVWAHPGLGTKIWGHCIVVVGVTTSNDIAYFDPAKKNQLYYMPYADLREENVKAFVHG